MRGDPRWILARFPSFCANKACGRRIRKGDSAWWWPRSRRVECEGCGRIADARFQAECELEAAGTWGAIL